MEKLSVLIPKPLNLRRLRIVLLEESVEHHALATIAVVVPGAARSVAAIIAGGIFAEIIGAPLHTGLLLLGTPAAAPFIALAASQSIAAAIDSALVI